jgi:hypothetical protein
MGEVEKLRIECAALGVKTLGVLKALPARVGTRRMFRVAFIKAW